MMNTRFNFNAVNLARWITIALCSTILFSPFFTNVIEIGLFALCLCSQNLRNRLFQLKKQPLALGVSAFILMLVLGCFYSVADTKETLSSLWGWRKILLLPIALSLFEDNVWKDRFLSVTVGFIFICGLLSILSFLFKFGIYRFDPGIVIRNYATQGMVFAVAIYAIVMRLIYMQKITIKKEWFNFAIIFLLLVALIFMTPGRSGYLALIVLSAYFCFRLIKVKKNYGLVFFISILIPFLLFNSSMVKNRVELGVHEIENVDQAHGKETSIGLRIIAWRNALELIKKHPILGVGTGGYETAFVAYIKNQEGWEGFIHHDPHNQFMKIFVELGLIGLIVFLSFLVSSLIQKPIPFYFHLSFGVLLAWCGTSLFSSHFSTFTEGRFIYLWLGALLAYKNKK